MNGKVEYLFADGVTEDDGKLSGTIVRYGDTAKDKRALRFEPGAFGTIDDVTLNVMHDRKRLLARTDGGGMDIADGADALTLTAELPDTTEARDAVAMVKRGVYRGLSAEVSLHDVRQGAGGVRIVKRATLTGVALVADPAMPQSSVAALEADAAGAGKAAFSPWWTVQ